MKNLFFILFSASVLSGCIEGGTHGYIKRFRYQTSKYKLERVVQKMIIENPAISQDSVKDYYNDDTNYVTIKISHSELCNIYIFHYYGGKEYWNSSPTSAISISYAYDKNGNGGSIGNGGVKWYEFKKRRRLIEPFEKDFINKIDSLLGLKHTEE